jgi:glucosamine--fructose-6-phosphate aminotransferase (isomerizing)
VADRPLKGKIGIGHTRWATHGDAERAQRAPTPGANGKVVVVHNGIVENFMELREELAAEGVLFNSDYGHRDHRAFDRALYGRGIQPGTGSCARRWCICKGQHGIVVMSKHEPDKIVCARIGNAWRVVIGKGENEMFIASISRYS